LKLLLDTHALLWWMTGDPKLGAAAMALISDRKNTILVSAVTLWEIQMKVRIRKLQADLGAIHGQMLVQDFGLLAIEPAHLIALGALPMDPEHKDPFDHLLIAQAITEGAVFLSEDGHTPKYPVQYLTCSGNGVAKIGTPTAGTP